MNNIVKEELQKALSYAFLLLKYRLRSEAEMRSRLKKKKLPDDIIEAAVGFLKDKDFINDRNFARLWLESRIRRSSGLRKIRQELKLKGIREELIKETVGALEDYDEESVVLTLAKKRLALLKGVAVEKRRQRLYGWLLRRGFSLDTVIEVLNKVT
ncbi:MAG: regulatory protein RecX [Candidatus Omnitrophica bacterium]|nr:regulatory protein RecX [Candidatus Omnitrophota bacterium]MDD5236545.1 regulatory protein RecX [Candidatus Omnitrophota bacterium]MDD5611088.1 regulatory protein RecX [Candidatus Omnitrophota bacterium]